MSTQVLVVEDEPAIRELIALNLKHAGLLVALAQSAEEAEILIRDCLPDAAIIDWMLPGQSGLQLAKNLRSKERTRDLPLIMLTARADEEDRILGLEIGFDDYVVKPFSPKELVARVRAVLRRRAPHLADETLTIGGLSLNPATHQVRSARLDGRAIELGPTEFRLLHFFMAHPERVYSRTQLLNEVWGDHVFIGDRSIDVYIRRLRTSLEPSGEHLRLDTVRGSGYRFLLEIP